MRPYLVPDAILDALSLIIFNPHKSLPRRHSDHANFIDEETGREVRWLTASGGGEDTWQNQELGWGRKAPAVS